MYKIPEDTLFLGKNLVILPAVDSTNTAAAEWSEKPGVTEGTVVITHNQESGRGQRGNSWESEPGKNLTFSIILHPKILPADFFNLNFTISLAVLDTVSQYQRGDLAVKWPNDIMVGNRKLCGILIENTIASGLINRSIAGIGLNVNQETFTISTATSLAKETGRSYDLNQVLRSLLHAVEVRYLQSKADPSRLRADYLNAMYWRDQSHRFRNDDQMFEGIIHGVDHNGRLQVKTELGLQTFGLKEIAYVD